jgi:large subunit ribosomal protein L25
MISLNVEKRKIGGNLDSLRKKGLIPAVFYGKKEASTPIVVQLNDFIKVWENAGESSVVTLKVKEGEELEALVHDVDLDPVTEVPRHADFYVFEKGQKIKLEIPIEFFGVSAAVKDLGGILIKVSRALEIEALPKDLPREIKVDISPLVNFESQILAKDITMPEGVALVGDANEVIALVSEAKEEVVEEVAAPVDLSAIEVEKKGKKEEEGAAAGDAGGAAPKAEKAEKGEGKK